MAMDFSFFSFLFVQAFLVRVVGDPLRHRRESEPMFSHGAMLNARDVLVGWASGSNLNMFRSTSVAVVVQRYSAVLGLLHDCGPWQVAICPVDLVVVLRRNPSLAFNSGLVSSCRRRDDPKPKVGIIPLLQLLAYTTSAFSTASSCLSPPIAHPLHRLPRH